MKKTSILLVVLASILALGCTEEKEIPKVIYEGAKTSAKAPASENDSTDIEIADLPIHMPGTSYLIHPVGDIRVYENRSNKAYGSGRASDAVSYAISNYSEFEITGYLDNLKFQHVDSTALYPLTDKMVQIQTATLIQADSPKVRKHLLVYTVADSDTNRDGRVDATDIRSLYLSDISGKNFTKISKDLQELIDWNVIDAQGMLYFRTIEDINKNGAFDKNDAVHYHYADLLSPEWTVLEYQPVGK